MSDRSTLLLQHHLRELRLPTFLREYDRMAAQCAAEGVDHPAYLLRLSLASADRRVASYDPVASWTRANRVANRTVPCVRPPPPLMGDTQSQRRIAALVGDRFGYSRIGQADRQMREPPRP